MTHKLLALYGLKWNPFAADVPVEALWAPPNLDHFRWRMEQQVREGGFALITGDPGTGKSVALRLLAHHLSTLPDVQIGVVMRPQSGLGDFYREIGALFGVVLAPHNRWAGFRALRERWLAHVEATRYRPVLLIDEAQEMSHPVLAELRILASTDFDSRAILTASTTSRAPWVRLRVGRRAVAYGRTPTYRSTLSSVAPRSGGACSRAPGCPAAREAPPHGVHHRGLVRLRWSSDPMVGFLCVRHTPQYSRVDRMAGDRSGTAGFDAEDHPSRLAPRANNRMKRTITPRAACGVACSPFGEHRGSRRLSVCYASHTRSTER